MLNGLDKDDASSFALLQVIFSESNESKALKTDFAYIQGHFNCLSKCTTKFEKTTNSVVRNNIINTKQSRQTEQNQRL